MRPGYKYPIVTRRRNVRASVDSTVGEFAETMRYGEQTFLDQQEFLQILEAPWVVELNQALGGILTPDRSILSVGSGLGEHEIPFHLDGYDITASDIVEYALLQTVNLFPGFRAIRFDIFNPDLTVQYDDVLITGLAFYFGSDEAQLIFDNARKLLKPAGSLIFTLRYHNNLATWFIDLVLSPSLAALRNAKFRLTGADLKCVKKCHGYRRSRGEIVAMAQAAGYQLGRVRHAGFGVELNRIELHRFAPGPYRFLRELDKRICVFNNATVFEFLT